MKNKLFSELLKHNGLFQLRSNIQNEMLDKISQDIHIDCREQSNISALPREKTSSSHFSLFSIMLVNKLLDVRNLLFLAILYLKVNYVFSLDREECDPPLGNYRNTCNVSSELVTFNLKSLQNFDICQFDITCWRYHFGDHGKTYRIYAQQGTANNSLQVEFSNIDGLLVRTEDTYPHPDFPEVRLFINTPFSSWQEVLLRYDENCIDISQDEEEERISCSRFNLIP